jgi:hypothetical protein
VKTGNASEQLEAALIETLIEGQVRELKGKEINRTYDVDENGTLVINSFVVVQRPVEEIRVKFNL